MTASDGERAVLVTGFPATFLARRVLVKVLESETEARAICLVPKKQVEAAEAELHKLEEAQHARVEIVVGDSLDMDFGMSGPRFLALSRRVAVVHHCAFATYA